MVPSGTDRGTSRCRRGSYASAALLLILSLMAGGAAAQLLRAIPAGERGTTGESLPLPEVKIDRRVLRLAPGGRIFDQMNRTIVHGALPTGADVLYIRNPQGEVQRIYILTDDERARLGRRGTGPLGPSATVFEGAQR